MPCLQGLTPLPILTHPYGACKLGDSEHLEYSEISEGSEGSEISEQKVRPHLGDGIIASPPLFTQLSTLNSKL